MTIRPSASDLARATRATAAQLASVQLLGLEYFAAQIPAQIPGQAAGRTAPAAARTSAHEAALEQMFAYYD